MYYLIGLEVKIGDYTFRRLSDIEIESSTKVIQDTAKIKLPLTAGLKRKGDYITEVELRKVFKVGDAVLIKAGYNGELHEEFRGFVKRIIPRSDILEVECEDGIYALRQKTLNTSFRKKTLQELVEFIIAGTNITLSGKIPLIVFKKFYFREVNAAQALQELKEKYGLTVYLKNGTQLIVGLTEENDGKTVKYYIGENVAQHDLEWQDESDVKIKIKAVHVRRDNTRVTGEFGSSDGEQRTLYFYNLENSKDLKTVAEAEAKKYQYRGFKGTLTGFLIPRCVTGNLVLVKDLNYENNEGVYLVDKVVTTIGNNGCRRKVSLGIKIK